MPDTMSLKRSLIAPPYLEIIERTNWLAKWRKTVRSAICPIFATREDMYRHIHSLLNDSPIDFLEFGVADGASMSEWCRINTRPESRFFGFDSFEGLPEHWHKNRPKGSFNRNGKTPEITDPRLNFRIRSEEHTSELQSPVHL